MLREAVLLARSRVFFLFWTLLAFVLLNCRVFHVRLCPGADVGLPCSVIPWEGALFIPVTLLECLPVLLCPSGAGDQSCMRYGRCRWTRDFHWCVMLLSLLFLIISNMLSFSKCYFMPFLLMFIILRVTSRDSFACLFTGQVSLVRSLQSFPNCSLCLQPGVNSQH